MKSKAKYTILIAVDSIFNIFENKRSFFVFFVFLLLGFIGIIITDSIVFSVSKKAEQELNVNGANKVRVEFYEPVQQILLQKIFGRISVDMSFSKRMILNVSDSPFSDASDTVTGIEYKELNENELYAGEMFKNNVIVISQEKSKSLHSIYVAGIPFKIVGLKKNSNTSFLDSLGINIQQSNSAYFMPLNTLIKLSLSNTVTGVNLTFANNITQKTVSEIEASLESANIKDYSVYSSVDAKKTVDQVIDRFKLLTNAIYIILNISSIAVIIIICRRNFQLRSTEFALKVIHGISLKNIIVVVILETSIVVAVAVVVSIITSLICLFFLSGLLRAPLEPRISMLFVSFMVLIMICMLSNVLFGFSFFKQNPIGIIKRSSI